MPRKWLVLAAVACGTFMATLDSSIVNIALPTLTKSLYVNIAVIKWVVISYILTITCLILPFGKLADQYGRKRVFFWGFAIFTLGSALCGIAGSVGSLIVFRIVQGIGGAMLMANGPAIITANFPASERGKALGTLAMVVSAGLISGPALGGLLIYELGWRSVFLVNIPVGLLGLYLVHKVIAPDKKLKPAPFDWAGAFLQCFLLISFIIIFDPPAISISGGESVGISRWGLVALTLLLFFVFVKLEKQVKSPIFDFDILKIPAFNKAILAGFFMFVSYSSVAVLMPFYLEEVKLFATREAGLVMTAIPVTILIVAPISGRLSDRIGTRGLTAFGAVVAALSLFLMAGSIGEGITKDTSLINIIVLLSTVGLAMGLFQSPNNNAIMGNVPNDKLGISSAFLATVRNLGLVVGTGLATGIFTWRQSISNDFVSALHMSFTVAGLIGLLTIVASLGDKKGPYWTGRTHGLEKKRKRTHA